MMRPMPRDERRAVLMVFMACALPRVIAAAAAIVMLAEVQLVTQPASAPVASAMVRLASRWSSAMSTA